GAAAAGRPAGRGAGGATVTATREAGAPRTAPYDPLRLCVYATVALLAWLLGPLAVFGFAVLGFAGYLRARRGGLTRSRCVLRDTRLVLAYLGVLAVAGAVGVGWRVAGWLA
ncbi:MAG TPA: hypothetical protein VES42_29200, partial [Pilimelia sp.]|nr:hypothetical protein [Pilimelia sp.]